MKLALLVSGKLGLETLQSIADSDHDLVAIFTDSKSEDIVSFSQEKDLPIFVGNPRKGDVESFIDNKYPELLLSVNYLFLIDEIMIQWPTKYALNIHGSLLPKYRGRTPHVWAIINGEQFSGVTIHEIVKECDAGDIVKQIKLPITYDDTGGALLAKFQSQYPKLVRELLHQVENDEVTFTKQDHNKATFFKKRTPDHGEIRWEWSKTRIRNWIRAQASPYPGAFCWYQGGKVIIDQVELDDWGFHQDDENGRILTTQPLRIKCTDGAIIVKKLRSDYSFKIGEKFD